MAAGEEGRPPDLDPRAISELISANFPFSFVDQNSFKNFPSYEDLNVYFSGKKEGAEIEESFVLKLYNNIVNTPEEQDALNSVMLWASDRGVLCCRPVRSRDGKYAVRSDLGSSAGIDYVVKIMTFIPGTVMDKLDKKYLTPELSYSVGSTCGKLDQALQDFRNPVIENRRLKDWDLRYFTDIKQYIPHVKEEEKRKMADSVVAKFEEYVTPVIPEMKKGVVHHDVSGLNLIFDTSTDKCVFGGLIDFGHCIHSCYLFELAIMMAYGMIEKENPVEFVGPMFKGYQDVFPLSKKELNCLYYAVLARLCQSAVNGEYRYTLEPWNSYLLTTPAEAWKLMKILLDLGKNRVEEIWGLQINLQ